MARADQVFEEYYQMVETVTFMELSALEKVLDKVFSAINVDIEWTKHFLDRANDKRNGKPINIIEIRDLFKQLFIQFKDKIANAKDGFEAVVDDLTSDINVPFIIQTIRDASGKISRKLTSKTIMRNKDFKTRTPKWKVKS